MITVANQERINESALNSTSAAVYKGLIVNNTCLLYLTECAEIMNLAILPGKDNLQVKIEGLSKGASMYSSYIIDACTLLQFRDPSPYAMCGNITIDDCHRCVRHCVAIDCLHGLGAVSSSCGYNRVVRLQPMRTRH